MVESSVVVAVAVESLDTAVVMSTVRKALRFLLGFATTGYACRPGTIIESGLAAAARKCCTGVNFRAGPSNSFPRVRCIDIRSAICGCNCYRNAPLSL